MTEINLSKKISLPGKTLEINVQTGFTDGNVLGLIGRSGTGKTTLLKMIAGLEKPDSGKIVINDKVWYSYYDKINLPTRKRSVGMVFQDYLLFPNMTVRENLSFSGNSTRTEIMEMVELVGLSNEIDRLPTKLSGGQQQRVALARALLRKPTILLLDEPLSALDYSLREKLQDDLKRLLGKFNIPTILVSHNLQEVAFLADKVLSIEGDSDVLPRVVSTYEIIHMSDDKETITLSDLNGNTFKLPAKSIPVKYPLIGMKISISSDSR